MTNLYVVDQNEKDKTKLSDAIAHRNYDIRWFSRGSQFLKVCNTIQPGIAIVDICLPDLDGLALQKALAQECDKDLPIIFLNGQCDVSDAVAAMREGAIDFLRKPFRRRELMKALDRAEFVLSEHAKRMRMSEQIEPVVANLTPRELDVLRASNQGESSKMVAHKLGLSTRTIEMHRSHIIKKLNVPNFAAALLFALPAVVEKS